MSKVEHPHVGCREVGGFDQQEAVRKGHLQRDGVAQPVLLVDELVLLGGRPELVAIDLFTQLHRVSADIEQPLAVTRPDDVTAYFSNRVGEVASGRQVANPDDIALRAVLVYRVGNKAMVGADEDTRDGEGQAPPGQDVLVKQHLLGATTARPPAMHAALRAEGIACEILPGPPRLGHRLIAAAEPPTHLGSELMLERTVGGQHSARVGIFCVEVGADTRLQGRGLADDLLGVLGPEPSVVVDQPDAVMLGRDGSALRHWRRRRPGSKRGVFGKANGEYRDDSIHGASDTHRLLPPSAPNIFETSLRTRRGCRQSGAKQWRLGQTKSRAASYACDREWTKCGTTRRKIVAAGVDRGINRTPSYEVQGCPPPQHIAAGYSHDRVG